MTFPEAVACGKRWDHPTPTWDDHVCFRAVGHKGRCICRCGSTEEDQ